VATLLVAARLVRALLVRALLVARLLVPTLLVAALLVPGARGVVGVALRVVLVRLLGGPVRAPRPSSTATPSRIPPTSRPVCPMIPLATVRVARGPAYTVSSAP
jgi:hypothetical protein